MKTRILLLITVIAVVMFGAVKEAAAQGKAIYFMKDGNVTYTSAIANIDSIIFAPPIPPTLSVEPSALSFTAAATETHDVVVTTNQQSWDATSNQTWCTITKGTNQFTVSATANTGTDNRTATIRITAGNATGINLLVTQKGLIGSATVENILSGITTMSYMGAFFVTGGYTDIIIQGTSSGTVTLKFGFSGTVGSVTATTTLNVAENKTYTVRVPINGNISGGTAWGGYFFAEIGTSKKQLSSYLMFMNTLTFDNLLVSEN